MSKNFITKEDIIKLLDIISDENGYVDKDKLFLNINKLDTRIEEEAEAEQIIPQITAPRKKEREGAYNINNHLHAINKYQQEVKAKIRKSYIHLHMENHFGITINKNDLKIYLTGKEMRIKERGRDFIIPAYNPGEINNLDIVTTERELMNILNISKGTVNTWRKKGIIKEYRIRIQNKNTCQN